MCKHKTNVNLNIHDLLSVELNISIIWQNLCTVGSAHPPHEHGGHLHLDLTFRLVVVMHNELKV